MKRYDKAFSDEERKIAREKAIKYIKKMKMNLTESNIGTETYYFLRGKIDTSDVNKNRKYGNYKKMMIEKFKQLKKNK